MQQDIQKIWFFLQSPPEVWEYLTRPELIEQWLMKTDFKPIKGQKFQFTFTPKPGSPYEGMVDCEVLEIKPFSSLSYSWNGRTMDKSRSFHSTVVWTLVPKDNGTELQLRHNGFEMMDDILAHSSGWENCIQRMKEHTKSLQQ